MSKSSDPAYKFPWIKLLNWVKYKVFHLHIFLRNAEIYRTIKLRFGTGFWDAKVQLIALYELNTERNGE